MIKKNLYHKRLVADSAAKACWICYKPSPTVLITPESDDWFYICPGHLKDTKFAIAQDAEDVEKAKRNEELEKEIAAVKEEYAERRRKKLAKRKGKDDSKQKDEKDAQKQDAADEEKDEKEKQAKLAELEGKKEQEKVKIEGPRIFELHASVYKMRVQKKREAEQARKNRSRLQDPGTFPSVPRGDL